MTDPAAAPLSFDNFIREWAREKPDVPALIEDDRTLSFAGLAKRTAQVVAAIARLHN